MVVVVVVEVLLLNVSSSLLQIKSVLYFNVLCCELKLSIVCVFVTFNCMFLLFKFFTVFFPLNFYQSFQRFSLEKKKANKRGVLGQ